MKIRYNLHSLQQNKELFNYLKEGKTNVQIADSFIEYSQNIIDKLQSVIPLVSVEERKEINHKIKRIKEENEKIKIDPLPYFIKLIENEREIITEQPFDFEYDDIDWIIYSSYDFYKFFPCPEEMKSKILFMDDFFPIIVNSSFSPLLELFSKIEKSFIEMGNDAIDYNIFRLHHLMGFITSNPDLINDVIMNHERNLGIPTKWIPIFKNIDKIKNKEFKVEVINYIWMHYLLNNRFYTPIPEIENELFSKAIKSMQE